MENKPKKEILLDQRKQTVGVQADTDGFYFPHTVFLKNIFDQLEISKNQ